MEELKTTGTIEGRKYKAGERKDRKPYIRVAYKVNDTWYSTFDTELQTNVEGENVDITYFKKDDFCNILNITKSDNQDVTIEEIHEVDLSNKPKQVDSDSMGEIAYQLKRIADAMEKQ